MFQYPFPMLAMTADLVVFKHGHGDNKALHVLMIRRGSDPYKGFLALPGGFVNALTETMLEAAIREPLEEVHLDVSKMKLIHVGIWDKPDRDPRGRTISSCYYVVINDEQALKCKAGDDAASIEWVEVNDIQYDIVKVAFDHQEMIVEARRKLFYRIDW